ncbi:MAG: endolytic transglycosylase MltG [Hyphomicrobiales bacterium]|nr:endolytic transglycosylase MltG [Hyphomicrobiales bacterium]
MHGAAFTEHAECNERKTVVTKPDPPPGGGNRPATPASPAPAGAVGAPQPSARAAPAGSRPAVGGASGSPSRSASERPAARSSVPNSRDPGRAVSGSGQPYPPISERSVNGIGTGSVPAKNSKPLTPRSPRTAIEPDTVEIPTRRSRSARNPFVVVGNAIISLIVLVAIVTGIALAVGKHRFDAPGPLPEDRVVNIPRGVGIRDIADVLMRDGVIDQPWVFVGGVLVLKAREGLKAGEYQFKAHASVRDVVATIVDGRVVAHQITIPEGLTSEQIVARLLDDDVLTGNIKEIPREGTLLPDTYNFTRGTTREQMIQRMQQAQQRTLKEIWDRRSPDLPIKTPEQLVTLASLVEKETAKPEERSRVAAVFVNRLKQKMRLQSDPTIIYGLVGGKGMLGRPIMKSEIDQPTPYNTYQIDGLPPGPIANPGRASLEAAANPARTRELYFVADGTGGHAFAETYEQHQKNVARLRATEVDQKDQAAPNAQMVSSPPQSAPAASAQAQPPHRAPPHKSQTPAIRQPATH